MQLRVPNLQPGERSLPAEMRTRPGQRFAQRRLMTGVASVAGLGDTCLSYDEMGDCQAWDTSSPVPVINTDPIATPLDCSSFALSATQAASCGISTSGGNITGEQVVQTALIKQGIDAGTATSAATYATAPTGYTGPTVLAANSATPAAPAGYNWATLINASGQNLAKILTIAQGGSSVTLPNGTQLLYGSSGSAAASSALSTIASSTGLSSSTLVLIGVGLLVFVLMGNKR